MKRFVFKGTCSNPSQFEHNGAHDPADKTSGDRLQWKTSSPATISNWLFLHLLGISEDITIPGYMQKS